MVQAVLWDNDGILVDSETVFYEMSRSAFSRMGFDLTREIWGVQFLGEGRRSDEIAASMGVDPSVYRPILEKRNARFRSILNNNPPPLREQVRETIVQLAGKVKLGIVTGSHRDAFTAMHRSSGLTDFFEVIITGDDSERPKPDPGLYLAALKALKLHGEECLAVEDSRRGLLAARAAGIPCVVVPTELTCMQKFPEALAVVQEISAVLKYI